MWRKVLLGLVGLFLLFVFVHPHGFFFQDRIVDPIEISFFHSLEDEELGRYEVDDLLDPISWVDRISFLIVRSTDSVRLSIVSRLDRPPKSSAQS